MKKIPALLTGVALGLSSILTSSFADTEVDSFPDKSVRLVVTVAPGASSDMLSRAIARKLSEIWGQSVVVENVPGASGNIGLRQVAESEPDGYTIVSNGTGLALSANLFDDLAFDPLNDFVGITQAVSNPQILVVHPGLGVSNFEEYLTLVEEKEGGLLFGLPGYGGIAHLINALVEERTNTRVRYLPYSGGAPAAIDLLGGQIDAVMITLAAVTEHVREGRLVPIAVSTQERSTALPDVPTFDELGLTGFDIGSWQGFLAPAGTPDAIVEKLYEGFSAAILDEEVSAYLEGQGFNVVASSPQATDELIEREIAQFGAIIESAGIDTKQ